MRVVADSENWTVAIQRLIQIPQNVAVVWKEFEKRKRRTEKKEGKKDGKARKKKKRKKEKWKEKKRTGEEEIDERGRKGRKEK